MPSQTIELTEFQPKYISSDAIPEAALRLLHTQFKSQVKIERPPFGDQIKLIAQGWVGQIPLTSELRVSLQPKIPLQNLFGMLEVAYDIPIKKLGGLVEADSVEQFYERLAEMLAQRVLQQSRRGLYKQYLPKQDRLPYIRGRMQVRELHNVGPNVACAFEEVSADIAPNQILYYTLTQIINANICSERTLPTVRKARRTLHGSITLTPFTSADVAALPYDRLSEAYKPMHALCAFFLDQIGPSHKTGDRTMVPFLLDMAQLFEKFVFRMLERESAETPYEVRYQVPVNLDSDHQLFYKIDIVLRDRATQNVLCVLDTKYKLHTKPSNADFNQAVGYALSQNCQDAILIYPHANLTNFRVRNGDVTVRSLPFDLDADPIQSSDHLFTKITERKG